MADLKIEVAHKLSRDEAVSRLQKVLSEKDTADSLLADVDFDHEGTRFSFSGKVKGFKVSGKMAVLEQSVRMIVTLPWAATAFSKTADEQIKDYLTAALA
jgi:hypothetical protein